MNIYQQIDSNKRKTAIFIAIFIIIILAIGYFLGYWYGGYGIGGLILAAFFAIPFSLIGYFTSDKLTLALGGAKLVEPESGKELYRIVENLCITAGLTVPKIYTIQDPSINAFATGRKPKTASIALTTGALEKLEKTELEGVIAHELSHIKNYDIRLMTVVVIFVGLIGLLSYFFMRFGFLGGRRKSSGNSGGEIGIVIMIVGLVFLVLSPIIAELIKLAISRKREFLADASGALLTRYPEGLANALEKIKNDPTPLQRINDVTAHLYISSPLLHKKGWLSRLYSTHPPIEERIEKLKSNT